MRKISWVEVNDPLACRSVVCFKLRRGSPGGHQHSAFSGWTSKTGVKGMSFTIVADMAQWLHVQVVTWQGVQMQLLANFLPSSLPH